MFVHFCVQYFGAFVNMLFNIIIINLKIFSKYWGDRWAKYISKVVSCNFLIFFITSEYRYGLEVALQIDIILEASPLVFKMLSFYLYNMRGFFSIPTSSKDNIFIFPVWLIIMTVVCAYLRISKNPKNTKSILFFLVAKSLANFLPIAAEALALHKSLREAKKMYL